MTDVTHARAEYYKAYRAKNRERIRAYQKEWRATHPEQVKEYMVRFWTKKAEEAAAVAPEEGTAEGNN